MRRVQETICKYLAAWRMMVCAVFPSLQMDFSRHSDLARQFCFVRALATVVLDDPRLDATKQDLNLSDVLRLIWKQPGC